MRVCARYSYATPLVRSSPLPSLSTPRPFRLTSSPPLSTSTHAALHPRAPSLPRAVLVYFGALTKILGGLGPLGSASVGESALYCLTNLLVRVSFAILQGYILRVLTTGDPDEMRFRNKLDALNYMSE